MFFVLQEHDVFGSVRRSVLQCSVRRPVFEQESRAAARKPRDAASVLFR